ncbi:MAG: SPFH domain-containing protein [Candidatus Micrarchaeia archaeon]
MAATDVIFALIGFFGFPALILIAILAFMSIKMIYQYEKGVVFTLGKFGGLREPGLTFVFPFIQEMRKVDMRIRTLDIPSQRVMTKDNVPVSVNGVVFFNVQSPETAVIKVQDYYYAISQYSQTALRDVIGGMTLDSVLSERQNVGDEIKTLVDKEIESWGLNVTSMKLQDVEVPDDLKRLMSRQAAAEREKRATVIKSEGDREAAANLAKAAEIMGKSPGALQLRTLQTLDGLGPTPSNTVIIPVPINLFEGLSQALVKKKGSKE